MTEPPVTQSGGDFSAEDWGSYLSSELGRSVRVHYGRARRQVIVAYPEPAGLRVRMNKAFGRAPVSVRAAVVDWLRVGRRARASCHRLDEWIASMVSTLGPPPTPRVVARGACHDLAEIAEDLLQREFRELPPERRPSGITWGRRASRSARHSLQLGSFDPETRLIRVHPVLDQAGVPRWFVRYVLFHELLHAELDRTEQESGRARHHGPEFRRLEAAYPGSAPALTWQEEHISALLRSARTQKPMVLPRRKGLLRWLQPLLFE